MTLDAALRLALPAQRSRPLSFFEFWPNWAFYLPVALHWMVLGVRYRDFSLPTAANPTITAGGLCGESKREILDQMTGEPRDLLARYTSIVTHRWDTQADTQAAEQAMASARLQFPVVAKPDIACNGTGVRLICDSTDLFRYFAAFPRGERMLLQEFIAREAEAGLFYVRHPDQPTGQVTSVTLKHAPIVTGDGRSTLKQLILADPRAGQVPQLYLPRLLRRLHEVPRQGERVRLVFVGNHCKGSIFQDATRLVTPALTRSVERIASAMPQFYFGRIDVRFSTLPALLRGEGFRIIEINGAGSEATHVWDPATRLRDAWRAQFFHYGAAFRIGAANRARGRKSTGLRALYALWRNQRRLMSLYPLND